VKNLEKNSPRERSMTHTAPATSEPAVVRKKESNRRVFVHLDKPIFRLFLHMLAIDATAE
jgi:hypothetical protein